MQTTVMILKSLLIWMAIIPLAVLNGVFRESVLTRMLGAVGARAASGVMLGTAIFALVYWAIPFVGRGSAADFALIGFVWLACTIAFECGFGRVVVGKSWTEIFAPYFFRGGDLWPLVLLVVAASPYLAAELKGLVFLS
jgi:hypothetical protein